MAYGLSDALVTVIRNCLGHKSSWRLGTSGTVEASVGTPVAKLSVGDYGGVLYMGRGDAEVYIPFPFVGAGASAGIGTSALTVSLPSDLSTGMEVGRLYLMPSLDGIDLDIDTIQGPCVCIGLLTGARNSGYASLYLFGGMVSAMPTWPAMTVKAVAFQAGLSHTAGVNIISGSAYQMLVLPPTNKGQRV